MVNREVMRSAIIVIATAPILVLYPFLQRYFVKGVMIGALKDNPPAIGRVKDSYSHRRRGNEQSKS